MGRPLDKGADGILNTGFEAGEKRAHCTQAKKEGHRIAPGPYKGEGQKTSRGEQLLRWNWEEKATMCISYVRYGGFLCSEQCPFVQASHAQRAML
ncbi:hypothetical protein [Neorhizobium petrolearium]|uniref:hypothetical protein n=1 Tax=Neorhizobium petrolearium TaxID=515361 RepID=UPI003F7E2C2B